VTHDRAVLFDMDGVLVQTEALKARAHTAAVEHLGGGVPEGFYPTVMGRSHESVRGAFLAAAGLDGADPARYTRFYRAYYRRLVQSEVYVTPGVVELIESLSAFRLAVVSSSRAETVAQVLEQTGLARYFPVRVSADDTARHKPAPDPYLCALERLSLPATRGVAIEDSQSGVESAAAAGLPVLALCHAFNCGQDFSPAAAVLDDLSDTCSVVRLIQDLLNCPCELPMSLRAALSERNRPNVLSP
jgi:HAD superfamily hydrolase (TIGR01509 family)